MSDSSATYHEPLERLRPETMDMHRALVSLQEELEAVDWYRQRADACGDQDLRAILLHNMREEVEHACMVLEWMRRNDADFDDYLHSYLYAEGDILAVEEAKEAREVGDEPRRSDDAAPAFTVGSLKPRPGAGGRD